jgi:predicted phosphodiesterase
MSRRAIISDIHSNLPAFEAVLADIKTQNVDAIVCLGDVCGYGPQPMECIELVRKNVLWTLQGNHDEALFVEPRDFGKNARLAIEWQRRVLEPRLESTQEEEERWFWLQGLQPRRVENDVLFVHASPREPLYEYVLREDFLDEGFGPSEKGKAIMDSFQWLCFCGHSHRPGVVSQDFQWHLPADLKEMTCFLKRGQKTLINVGSVGQPRDGITSACYVVFDYTDPAELTKTVKIAPLPTDVGPVGLLEFDEPIGAQDETRTSEELQRARATVLLSMPRVMFRRVQYDIAEAQARFKNAPDLPQSNAVRLAKGL